MPGIVRSTSHGFLNLTCTPIPRRIPVTDGDTEHGRLRPCPHGTTGLAQSVAEWAVPDCRPHSHPRAARHHLVPFVPRATGCWSTTGQNYRPYQTRKQFPMQHLVETNVRHIRGSISSTDIRKKETWCEGWGFTAALDGVPCDEELLPGSIQT